MTTAIDRIFHAWDDAFGRKNVDDAWGLYALDATLESPLVRHLLGTESGVVKGTRRLAQLHCKSLRNAARRAASLS
jgi:hypothetical protein